MGEDRIKQEANPTLEVGTRVYVRTHFLDNKWTDGFEIAEVLVDGYRLRRLSDGYVFPDVFPIEDVGRDRRRDPMRGITGSYLDRRH